MKPIIGIIGGIGSGKSAVASILASKGAGVVSADRLAHECLQSPEGLAKLAEWWGPVVVKDNLIDRELIREIIRSNPDELKRLENFVHPYVKIKVKELTSEYMETCDYVVWDIPLLLEAGYWEDCTTILFVDADISVRQKRVQESRLWQPEDLELLESRQYPLNYKKCCADYVLVNHSGDMSHLIIQIDLIEWWKKPDLSPEEKQKRLKARMDAAPKPDWAKNDIIFEGIEVWGPWKKTIDGKERGNDGGFKLRWSKPWTGFGELTFVVKDGKLSCDSECMSLRFIKQALEKMAETGFGELTFVVKDGKLSCDSEFMSLRFIKQALEKMAESAEIK